MPSRHWQKLLRHSASVLSVCIHCSSYIHSSFILEATKVHNGFSIVKFLIFFFCLIIVYLCNTFVAYSRLLSCNHPDKHRGHFPLVLSYVHKMHKLDNRCLICRCCCFLEYKKLSLLSIMGKNLQIILNNLVVMYIQIKRNLLKWTKQIQHRRSWPLRKSDCCSKIK